MDKFTLLKRLLSGSKAQFKTPSERPSLRSQRRAFDTFARAATSLYNQALAGSAERAERIKDYEVMDQTPEISTALNIYSDDSITTNVEGDILEIVSDNEKIIRELEELYYERLDIGFHLWDWARNCCKYGDHFNLLDITEKEGVLGTISLPVLEIEREEGYDGDPNSLRFKWMAGANTVFENYQISHMRILGDNRFLPYGRSVLEPGRKIWKQLQMAEDAMLIYRMIRAPERLVFNIDVANIPPDQVENYINSVRDKLQRTPLVTESTGEIDLRYNPMSITENYYVPVRGDRGTKIDQLSGGTNQGDIEDIEYLQNKLFIALGVPKSYMTAEEDLSGRAALSQEDIKFARTIQRIQKVIISELAKIGIIHLFLRGYSDDDIYNFDLKLTNPSTVTEMMQLELLDKRFSLAQQMAETPLISDLYVQENVLKLTRQEITEINDRLFDEARRKYILDNIQTQGEELPAETETDDEEDDETEDAFNSLKVPDPAGTNEIPGAPNIESSVDGNGFMHKKKRKKISDPFSGRISDIVSKDASFERIFENLKNDKENGAVFRKSIKKVVQHRHENNKVIQEVK